MDYFEIKTKYGGRFIEEGEEGGEFIRPNIGESERVVRVLIGIAIIAIAIFYNSWWGLLGLEVLATGIFGWSPIYKLSGMSRNKVHHGLVR